MVLSYEQFKDKIKNADKLLIYGAGVVAYGAYEAIGMICEKRIDAFIVSDSAENKKSLAGVAIKQVSEELFDGERTFVLVATPEEYHAQIAEMLKADACKNFAFLTSHLEYCLMGEYLKMTEGIRCIEDEEIIFDTAKANLDASIYMAISHKDKELVKTYDEESFVKKIQVGASLTDTVLTGADLFDNVGENISTENPIYGELTATYHAWKNDLHDIMGLFHYRRVLKVTKEQLVMLDTGKADVILPLPFVCYPDASGQYGRYLNQEDIEVMLEVLRDSYPGIYDKATEVLKGKHLYNYNMLIAKKEVFEDYCAWMFSLLAEIAKRCEAVSRERLPRYIGRIGEVLTSVYFMINEKNWKIVHAEKVWRT